MTKEKITKWYYLQQYTYPLNQNKFVFNISLIKSNNVISKILIFHWRIIN